MNSEQEIITIIESVLNIEGYKLTGDSPLLGHIPEFDSQAVIAVITAIEEHFGIFFEDEEVSAEIFETVKTLNTFVEQKL